MAISGHRSEASLRNSIMFRWNRLSLDHKTLALKSLFSTLSCEKIRVFLWAIIRLKFTEHFTLRFCIRDSTFARNLRAKVFNSTCRTIKFASYCRMWTLVIFELWWFDILTALVLHTQWDYLYHSNRDSDWLMLTTPLFALETKFVLKVESNAWEI